MGANIAARLWRTNADVGRHAVDRRAAADAFRAAIGRPECADVR
jgi:hypothetical protein